MSDANIMQEESMENQETPALDQEVIFDVPVPKKPKRRKLIWIAGIILILSLGGFGLYKWLGTSKNATFLTMPAVKGTVSDSIQATGTLNPVKKAALGFKNNGNITALNAQPGDRVTEGQVLAQQDPTSLRAALQQAQSQLSQDQISVQNQTLTYEANRRNLDQQQSLFNAGAVSQSAFDTARDTFNKSELDLTSAKARLVNDQAKVDQAQSDLDGATLTAPFDGIVGTVNGQVGQINGYGTSGNTLLDVISEDLELSALVNEVDMGRIQVGQDVEFTTSAYANKTFQGKVARVNPEATTVSNVQYYPVLISCVDPDHQLRAGMSVSASIVIARKSDVLTVPMMAVSYAQTYIKNNQQTGTQSSSTRTRQANTSGTQGNNQSSTAGNSATGIPSQQQGRRATVLVLENNLPVSKQVVLGLSDGQNYEVVQGINEGDKIIVGTNQAADQSTSSGSSSGSQQQNRTQSPLGGAGGVMRVRGN
ncbi:MAG TPA: efflux RND transporter periplasmic adaptor subunit [Syntrophomonadaceae bacterium]|nr:efflux RND transporter periplasmic adaptor subunit [Syntrophomonadaceae bacterium]